MYCYGKEQEDPSDPEETDCEVRKKHYGNIEQDESDSEEGYELSTKLSYIGKHTISYSSNAFFIK